MRKRNSGQSEAEILQNQFTAYLSRAISRRKKAYILETMKRLQAENLMEEPGFEIAYDTEHQILEELPLLIRLENDSLLYALKELTERERYVFLARVLDEKRFEELAVELGLTYKGVAAIYYRAVHKVKDRMREVDDEL